MTPSQSGKAMSEVREIRPFGHDDPATCDHRWELHLWEQGKEYCPYCASMRAYLAADEGDDHE
jgi:hypothetical protein